MSESSQGQHPIFLRPEQAAKFLSNNGYRCSKATLNKLRCVGGGPRFRKFGRYVGYTYSDLNHWVGSRLSPILTSTSSEK